MLDEQPGLFQHGPAEAMHGRGAVLSDDGVYRYRLWRIWDRDRLPTTFVMLNPSTADASAWVRDPASSTLGVAARHAHTETR